MQADVRAQAGVPGSDLEIRVAAQRGTLERQRAEELHRLKRQRLDRLYGQDGADRADRTDGAGDEDCASSARARAADGYSDDYEVDEGAEGDESGGGGSWHVEERPDAEEDGDEADGDVDYEEMDEDELDDEDVDEFDDLSELGPSGRSGARSADDDEFEAALEAALAEEAFAEAAAAAAGSGGAASAGAGGRAGGFSTAREAMGAGMGRGAAGVGRWMAGLSASERAAQYALFGGAGAADLAGFLREDSDTSDSDDGGQRAAAADEDVEDISTHARATLESLRAVRAPAVADRSA